MNFIFRSVVIAGLAAFLLIWSLAGCAGTQEKAEAPPPVQQVQPPPVETKAPEPLPAAPPEEPKEPPYLVHTVTWPGETLALIAKWYTGDTENWRAIAKANPRLNPRRIRLGSQIQIPSELVKNREPMPKEFVTHRGATSKATPAANP
jgi:LysM repeat protein